MMLTSRDPWRGAADGDDVQSAFMFVTSQKQQTVVCEETFSFCLFFVSVCCDNNIFIKSASLISLVNELDVQINFRHD